MATKIANPPSPKQLDLIKALARKAGFDSASDAGFAAGLSNRHGMAPDLRFDISSADASVLIDQLKDGLAPEPETTGLSDVSTEALLAELQSRGAI